MVLLVPGTSRYHSAKVCALVTLPEQEAHPLITPVQQEARGVKAGLHLIQRYIEANWLGRDLKGLHHGNAGA